LKEYLLPEISVAKEQFGIDLVLMQDNAPCHKARLVTVYFGFETCHDV
jgi:hypothetical protein